MQLAHDNKNHNRFVFKFDRKVIPRIEKIDKGMILTEINDDPKYNFKNFEFVRCGEKVHVLGTGAFGEVLLAINKIDSQLYAIKQIDLSKTKSSATARSLVMREINIHRRLSHENIVKLYSSYEEGNKIYLILEYVNKGNLYHLINSNKGLSEEKAFKYFIQVVYAVYFLHENKLIHRDIKPENILIGDKDEAKLCDFGWCIESDPSSRSSFCGTLEYIAPEIYNRKQYSYSVDAWSLGVLLYELVHGVSPFKTTSKVDQQKKIYSNIAENKIKIDGRVSSDCADLIKSKMS